MPDDELQADFYEVTQARLEAAGLPAYEISNHARPGQQCRHNLIYWRSGEWAGIGPGAHGRLNLAGARIATEAWRLPKTWLERVEAGSGERRRTPLTRREQVEELLVMGLRLAEGIELARLEQVAGRPLAQVLDARALTRLVEDGWLTLPPGRLAATAAGRQRLNAVLGRPALRCEAGHQRAPRSPLLSPSTSVVLSAGERIGVRGTKGMAAIEQPAAGAAEEVVDELPAERPPRNIVLLSDGTGNSAAKLNKTNVWTLYQALDLGGDDQIAYYDDGVGTAGFRPLRLLGGAFGWGLSRNVRQLYRFLCRHYRAGDQVYIFGFSRGAFTARTLAGLIARCGVLDCSKAVPAGRGRTCS